MCTNPVRFVLLRRKMKVEGFLIMARGDHVKERFCYFFAQDMEHGRAKLEIQGPELVLISFTAATHRVILDPADAQILHDLFSPGTKQSGTVFEYGQFISKNGWNGSLLRVFPRKSAQTVV